MSIASEITRISNNVADAYTAASGKGATMPATQNSANLASTISTIQTGTTPVISSLNVTPTTSAQQITAPQGTDGYSPVNVSAVTSSIDANIVAGNIKKDVQILGVTGSYEGTTPTGTKNITSNGVHNVAAYEYADVDVPTTAPAYYREFQVSNSGVLETNQTTSHVMDFTGIKEIPSQMLLSLYRDNPNITGNIDLSSIEKVGSNALQYAFSGTGITSIDLSGYKATSGTLSNSSLRDICFNCQYLVSVDLSKLLTPNSTSGFERAFGNCSSLTSVDVSSLQGVAGSNCLKECFRGSTSLKTFSAPNLYSVMGNSSFYGAFINSGLETVDLSKLLIVSSSTNNFYQAFSGCSSLTSVNIQNLAHIEQNNTFYQAFYNCTSLTTLSFNGLALNSTNFNNSLSNMLQGCSNVTVHFPAEWQTTMSSWSNVTNGFGGTNTTVLFDLPNVRSVDLSFITSLEGNLYRTYYNCTEITSVDLSNLMEVTGTNCLYALLEGCVSLTSCNVSSLKTISGSQALWQMLKNCTSITTISFPAIKTISTNGLMTNMLSGCTNVTVHFPSNMQSVIGSWSDVTSGFGGTNTTVLYDLPATNILTGADTKEYERNPKYDTGTALAWRINGTMPNTTTYYTSGLTDPTVGTTIYSDSACTIAETTVDSIA